MNAKKRHRWSAVALVVLTACGSGGPVEGVDHAPYVCSDEVGVTYECWRL